jgi:hypothetical protein
MSNQFGNIATSNQQASSVLFPSITLANPTTAFYTNGSVIPPDVPPSVPFEISSTSNTISVAFNIAGVGGIPTPTYGILWGPAGGPYNNQVIGGQFVGNTYFATFSGLPNTNYQCVSFAQNSAGIKKSAPSAILTTLPSSPSGPSSAPSIPQSNQGTIPPTSITVNFNVAGITGNPTPTYSILYGTTTNPTTPASAVQALGTLYSATVTGLTAGTTYYFKSVATNSVATLESPLSAGIITSGGTGVAPSGPPTVPVVFGAPTSSSITVNFSVAGITGTPTPQYHVLVGENPSNPTSIVSASLVSGTTYQATATDLALGSTYYFYSVATNGVLPDATSAVSAGINTAGGTPQPPLTTLVALPFIIQGPRFGATPGAWTGIDYYFSSAATGAFYTVGGTSTQGQQLFGNMYAGTVGAPGNLSGDPGNIVPYAGSCVADQVFNFNFGTSSDAYLTSVRTAMGTKGRMLACLGGFYADILGLFGPYQPTGYPGTNPTAAQVTQSFLYNYCGLTSGPNPLNWVRQNSNNTSSYNFFFDGLILDFENVGNGNPLNSYPFAPPGGGAPSFPAQATNPTYSPYIAELASIPTTYYSITPTLFLGNAPVSLSIVADKGITNICASNTALNTWYAFATATTPPNPTSNPFNTVASSALNHPAQMCYFDDIFIQFYNESADYYPGGQYFSNLLACWGIAAIEAQKLGVKNTTINLGLAKGNIIPGGGPPYVANAQGPTPPLEGQSGPPYTLWYPQYCTPEPPNAVTPNQYNLNWPNTGVTLDPKNVSDAIKAANDTIRAYYDDSSIEIYNWLSGMGFWAGGNATTTAAAVYNSSNTLSPANVGGTGVLPHKYVYCWGDASYPAPDPLWPANVPIVCSWE